MFGPPRDHAVALEVLREAIARGVNHIDTSDIYGPYVTNELICEALHPYPDDLVIITNIGARPGDDGSWLSAMSAHELMEAVHDNLRHLKLDVLNVVNLRMMFDSHGRAERSIEALPLTALAEPWQRALVRQIGLSNVTPAQVAEGRRIAEMVCVQNEYNLVHRGDDALIDDIARAGIADVPFFPLAGFTPLRSSASIRAGDAFFNGQARSRAAHLDRDRAGRHGPHAARVIRSAFDTAVLRGTPLFAAITPVRARCLVCSYGVPAPTESRIRTSSAYDFVYSRIHLPKSWSLRASSGGAL